MGDLDDKLDAVLDRWAVPPLGRDLTGQILARAADEERALDELLASADPKVTLSRDLPDDVLGRVRREEAGLDRLLAAAEPVPRLGGDLSGPVLRTIRRRRLRTRIVALAGSLAAAAAVAIVYLWPAGAGGPVQPTMTPPLATNPPAAVAGAQPGQLAGPDLDELVINNLELARDYPVFKHWDTIRAMEQLEGEAPGENSL